MKTIKINSEGFVESIYIKDATIEIEIEDPVYRMIENTPFNSAWKHVNGEFILVSFLDDDSLKQRRQRECFNIIDNRSQMWYNHLTAEQKQELEAWYQAWLDATETKVIPVKPEWL